MRRAARKVRDAPRRRCAGARIRARRPSRWSPGSPRSSHPGLCSRGRDRRARWRSLSLDPHSLWIAPAPAGSVREFPGSRTGRTRRRQENGRSSSGRSHASAAGVRARAGRPSTPPTDDHRPTLPNESTPSAFQPARGAGPRRERSRPRTAPAPIDTLRARCRPRSGHLCVHVAAAAVRLRRNRTTRGRDAQLQESRPRRPPRPPP